MNGSLVYLGGVCAARRALLEVRAQGAVLTVAHEEQLGCACGDGADQRDHVAVHAWTNGPMFNVQCSKSSGFVRFAARTDGRLPAVGRTCRTCGEGINTNNTNNTNNNTKKPTHARL